MLVLCATAGRAASPCSGILPVPPGALTHRLPRPLRIMSKIIAVSNQKGGVGKTTTTINLAASLAVANQRVLVVDMDPQGNLSSGLGHKAGDDHTVYEALVGDADLPILQTVVDRLHLVPAGRHLAGAEIELVTLEGRDGRLRRLLDVVRSQYDFIFIDTPPSLGLLTLNALVAADTVLIPLHCEYFALEGLADLMATLSRVRQALNPPLDVEGVVLTMYGDRTNLGAQVAREIRQFFESKVFDTVIPRNVRLAEAPSHGLPVLLYDPRSRGAEAYVSLARELLQRNGAHVQRAASAKA
jgi:chromosome partitioning protein